jgi:hypothetical protein
MLTIEEIEAACEASRTLDFSRDEKFDLPELSLRAMFYPLGFPAEVRTNSAEILSELAKIWGIFEKRFDTEPMRVDVHLIEGEDSECPPAPTYRLMKPLLMTVADKYNYVVADLSQNRTQATLSSGALKHKLYLRYFLLEPMVGHHIATRHTTPVHGGCLALDGRGVVLLGDSGAGKSSLSYACARAGWTYIADDASFLLNGGSERIIVGNCHQVRFRPTAADLFPEIEELAITPRAAGKPSIEMPTASMPDMVCAPTAHVEFLVFLNRRAGGPPELLPYRRDVARSFMRQVLFGLPETRANQYEAIERLLEADVFELRYSDLDWATERLQTLVRQGR